MPSDPTPAARPFPGARLRASRGLQVMYALIAGLVLVIAGAAAALPDVRQLMAWMAALLAIPMSLSLFLLRRYTVAAGGHVEVREDGVYARGRLAVPRASIQHADVARDGDQVTVVLRRRHGFVAVIEVAGEDEGRALVRALGRSADQALSVFRVDSPIASVMRWWQFYALLFVPLAAMQIIGPSLLSLMPFVYALLLAGYVPARITIGLDGILLSWMGLRRLVPFSALRGVDHDGERICLRLADGRARRFSVRWIGIGGGKRGGDATGFATREAYLSALVARVREAMAASGGADEATVTALLRRGRDLPAWVSALRGLVARGPAGFRAGDTPPDRLWRMVEDGAAAPEARAAAAIALQPALDDAARERLARVASVVVAPRLRIALTAVNEGDDEALMEALAALEAARDERGTAT